MDTTQLFLTFILILSTILLVAVGVQLFFALREFRKTLGRINGILDTAETASREIKVGTAHIVTLFDSFKSLLKTLEIINLLAPLRDYLRRRHKTIGVVAVHSAPKSTNNMHTLMNKMKDASEKKRQKKFIIKEGKAP